MSKNKQVAGGVVIAGFLAIFALMGTTSAGSLFANTASAGYGGSGTATKVVICHNGNTIKVAKSAVPAHLGHGDTKGACVPTPVVLGASTSNVEQIKALKLQLLSLLQQLLALTQAPK